MTIIWQSSDTIICYIPTATNIYYPVNRYIILLKICKFSFNLYMGSYLLIKLSSFKSDTNILSLISICENVKLYWHRLDKYIIVDIFCSKWTSRCIKIWYCSKISILKKQINSTCSMYLSLPCYASKQILLLRILYQ